MSSNIIEERATAADWLKALSEYFFKKGRRIPEKPITVSKDIYELSNLSSSREAISWLGHSTVFIKLDGLNIITDPMFSLRASPFQFIGPKKFDYELEFGIDILPEVDVVLISHDHYDHLDKSTIKKLKEMACLFYVGKGVGEYLKKWGIS